MTGMTDWTCPYCEARPEHAASTGWSEMQSMLWFYGHLRADHPTVYQLMPEPYRQLLESGTAARLLEEHREELTAYRMDRQTTSSPDQAGSWGGQCPCGRPLHYSDPVMRSAMERQVQRLGECIRVDVLGEGAWMVPRHYIALHSLRGGNLPALAAQLGFRPAPPSWKDPDDGG